uniref:Lectizyme n=1 Tax=Glossina palpalis gambiensis TaxID=67801 RepID=A0A1B0AT61_9MUSC
FYNAKYNLNCLSPKLTFWLYSDYSVQNASSRVSLITASASSKAGLAFSTLQERYQRLWSNESDFVVHIKIPISSLANKLAISPELNMLLINSKKASSLISLSVKMKLMKTMPTRETVAGEALSTLSGSNTNFELSAILIRSPLAKPQLANLTRMMIARSGTIIATVRNIILRFSENRLASNGNCLDISPPTNTASNSPRFLNIPSCILTTDQSVMTCLSLASISNSLLAPTQMSSTSSLCFNIGASKSFPKCHIRSTSVFKCLTSCNKVLVSPALASSFSINLVGASRLVSYKLVPGLLLPGGKVPESIRNYFTSEGDATLVSSLCTSSTNSQAREAAYRVFLYPSMKQEELLSDMIKCRHVLARTCGLKHMSVNLSKYEDVSIFPFYLHLWISLPMVTRRDFLANVFACLPHVVTKYERNLEIFSNIQPMKKSFSNCNMRINPYNRYSHLSIGILPSTRQLASLVRFSINVQTKPCPDDPGTSPNKLLITVINRIIEHERLDFFDVYKLIFVSKDISTISIIMKFFAVFALCVASVSAANLDAIAKPGFPAGRIINGHEAEKGEAPFIVSLKAGKGHFCGGSIIAENWVLTAGHCLIFDEFEIVAGLHSRNDESDVQIRKVTGKHQQIVHEKYGGGVGPNDIGLIYVDKPFNLNALTRDGTAAVAKVNLPTGKYESTGKGKLYGWGLDNSGFSPNILNTLDVDIIGYEECKNALNSDDPLDPVNICSYTAGATDGACNGDSGGPMVRITPDGTELVGIVSWGYVPCTASALPSVYTWTSAFDKWIEDSIKNYAQLL